MSASAPPFRAVKADAGVRAAGERVLDGTILLLDGSLQDLERDKRSARGAALRDDRDLACVEGRVNVPAEVITHGAEGNLLMFSHGPHGTVCAVQLRYAYRLNPTPGQRIALAKAFGCARVV